jgi:hypothetical protein
MSMGGGLLINSKAKESSITAVVTRADGTVEDLGVVAYWHRNPLRRFLWRINKFIKDHNL